MMSLKHLLIKLIVEYFAVFKLEILQFGLNILTQ